MVARLLRGEARKFIAWSWLRGERSTLLTRDLEVNKLGSLLDPAATGTAVPER